MEDLEKGDKEISEPNIDLFADALANDRNSKNSDLSLVEKLT